MNQSRIFIERPVATTLLLAAIALAGSAAFLLLPVSPLPQVDFPTISVFRRSARRESRNDGVLGRDSSGTPVWPHRRRFRDDLHQYARRHQRCPPV